MDPLVTTQLLNVAFGIATLAVLALGLAIVFGLLGVLNIAHGELVMVGAYAAWIVQGQGVPYLAAVPLAMLVCGLLGWAIEAGLIRPLYARPFDTLLATWGLSLLLRKTAEAIWGLGYKSLAVPVAGTTDVFGASYPTYRLLLIVACAAGIVALAVWFTKSGAGTRIKAMVANPELAQAVGIRTGRLARNAFVAGCALAGLGGVMVAPLTPVHPFMGIDYILETFFVLVVGGLGSITGLLAGSGIIGGLGSLVSAIADRTAGYTTVLVIAILFLSGFAPVASWLAHSAAVAVVLVLLPFGLGEFAAYQLALYFLYAIAALGVGLCWGGAGFLPLGQAMFVGIGGYLSGLALIQFKGSALLLLLLPLAALLPGLLAFGLGLILFRGRRETGPYFALITLALSLLAFQIANGWNSVTGGFNGLKSIPGLPGLDDLAHAYWISAAALGAVIVATSWLLRAPLGVLWRAVAQNERRVAFLGFDVTKTKAAVFGLSGVLGGIAGTLYAPQQNLVTPQLVGFTLSAELVIWAAVGGRGSLWGPIVGTILIGVTTAELRNTFAYWEVLLAVIFIVVVRWAPQGIVGLAEPVLRRLRWRTRGAPVTAPARRLGARTAAMAFDGVAASAGPVQILDGLTIGVENPGITCIIGPNGAGKTSCFNVLTGELPAAHGIVRFDGRAITGLEPTGVTRLGIARKFQIPNVFPDLSVADNLHLALWGGRAGVLDLLKPSLHRWTSPLLQELIQRYPFLAEGSRRAGDLGHGEKQILELAMALSMEPKLLLLDEPCAGLSPEETHAVIAVIRWARARLGVSVIIIEHDMSLVKELADHVLVLHQGRLLASGSIAEVQADPAVRAVYAGGTK